jgi:UDP-N-acetylmuramate dehydrogenase
VKLLENASLKACNTLGIDAKARYFLSLTDEASLQEALVWAREQQQPVLVIGEGSNLVLARDWAGLVLQIALKGIEVLEETAETVSIAIAGGEHWHDCVTRSVQSGWYGLENLALIPGTAGAAPVQNIGAYGIEISTLLKSVEAVSMSDGKHYAFNNADCGFRYRDSIFRGHCPNQWLITRIVLRLHKQPKTTVNYPALQEQLQQAGIEPATATPEQVMAAVIAIRQSKLPDPAVTPNAGSFFKNPTVDAATYQRLKAEHPTLVAYPAHDDWKLAAGWLIEQAGYKGVLRDGVGTAATQALVVVNPGYCRGDKVMAMAHEIQRAVQAAFGVTLDIEPLVVD